MPQHEHQLERVVRRAEGETDRRLERLVTQFKDGSRPLFSTTLTRSQQAELLGYLLDPQASPAQQQVARDTVEHQFRLAEQMRKQ